MKKHPTDLLSLVFGLGFAALVGWWAVTRATDQDMDGRWLAVTALTVVGVVILVNTLSRRTQNVEEPTPVVDNPPTEDLSHDEAAESPDDEPATGLRP